MSQLVQYVIVRGDLLKELKWPTGAVIAQACHAATSAIHMFYDDEDTAAYLKDINNMHKVVLEAENEGVLVNLRTKLEEHSIKHKLWIEHPENIATCLALKPYPKDVVHSYVKKLKLYK